MKTHIFYIRISIHKYKYELMARFLRYTLLSFAFLVPSILANQIRDGLGDINNDLFINILDTVRAVNIILENDPPPTDYELWAADVNYDQSVDVIDVIIITNYILGIGGICENGYSYCLDSIIECCPDITSHEFDCVIDTLGLSGSILYDATVIDEDDIWAVGTIETETGEYNIARWDGNTWEYLEVINSVDLYSIYYFSEDDIWVTTFGLPIHWDGNDWTLHHIQQMGIDASVGFDCWGTSSLNMFFVGYQGSIVHFNGIEFQQLESGTNVSLRDIHGTNDGEWVFACGYEETGESVALVYNNDEWLEIYSGDSYFIEPSSVYGRISSVEAFADTAYFTTTAGLLKYAFLEEEYILVAEEQDSFYNLQFVDISINTPNDLMLFSRAFSTLHFNGENWFHDDIFSEVQNTWSKGGDLNGDTFVNVGYISNGIYAYVVRGSRMY